MQHRGYYCARKMILGSNSERCPQDRKKEQDTPGIPQEHRRRIPSDGGVVGIAAHLQYDSRRQHPHHHGEHLEQPNDRDESGPVHFVCRTSAVNLVALAA